MKNRETATVSDEAPLQPQSQPELDAYSIEAFCRRHSISRSTYYTLKQTGKGPREAHVLGRVLVTKEAALEWRAKITEK